MPICLGCDQEKSIEDFPHWDDPQYAPICISCLEDAGRHFADLNEPDKNILTPKSVLEDENLTLKATVARLRVELSDFQRQHIRALDLAEYVKNYPYKTIDQDTAIYELKKSVELLLEETQVKDKRILAVEAESRTLRSDAIRALQELALTREELDEFKRIHNIKLKRKERDLDTSGYVYFISAVSGWVRIGKARHLEDRLKQHAKMPEPIKEFHHVVVSDRHRYEKVLHLYFAEKRLDGEWFDLDRHDLKKIKGLKSQGDIDRLVSR